MAEALSDLALVEEAIRALDEIPPVQRTIPPGEDGLSVFYKAGTIDYEFRLLTMRQKADDRILKAGQLENGQPLDPDSERTIRDRFEALEKNNRWGVIPWGRDRLSRLLARHLDGSVYPPPHSGFHGPRAGYDELSYELAPSTAVDWLLNCPQRCRACVNVCRDHLERLRRALKHEKGAAGRPSPPWTSDGARLLPSVTKIINALPLKKLGGVKGVHDDTVRSLSTPMREHGLLRRNAQGWHKTDRAAREVEADSRAAD